MPLEADRFSCPRSDYNGMVEDARREGEKILRHYEDASVCVVVFGAEVKIRDSNGTTILDVAVATHKDRTCSWRVLNPPVQNGKNFYHAYSPSLQPELAEGALEMAELPPF